MATTRVSLSPSPGFCIKSTALHDASLSLSSSSSGPASPSTINVPSGLKVFVNIAWDHNVPPPPHASDAQIQRAMSSGSPLSSQEAQQWFVPLILSDPRPDKDKAGKPSVVFDAIFNSTLKSRTLRSPDFKTFLVELAFQRIESQHSLLLSRQIGTPNIPAKGKILPRSVLVPTSLYQTHGDSTQPPSSTSITKPLIEEVDPASSLTSTPPASSKAAVPRKGILKVPSSAATVTTTTVPSAKPQMPELSWSRTDDDRLRIVLFVPNLTRDSIPTTTLDIESHRLIFSAPPPPGSAPSSYYELDLDLSQSDADVQKLWISSEGSARHALNLKRERAFDVDGARAEWRIAQGLFVIYV